MMVERTGDILRCWWHIFRVCLCTWPGINKGLLALKKAVRKLLNLWWKLHEKVLGKVLKWQERRKRVGRSPFLGLRDLSRVRGATGEGLVMALNDGRE